MSERGQNIVKLLEKHVADMDNEFDTLDKKAQQNIAVSSIVATIVGALKLTETLPFKSNDPALYAIFAVYGLAFVVSLIALYPQKWTRTPLDPTMENVIKVENKEETEYRQWLIDSYLYILRQNDNTLSRKRNLVVIGIVCLLLEVGVIAYAALSH